MWLLVPLVLWASLGGTVEAPGPGRGQIRLKGPLSISDKRHGDLKDNNNHYNDNYNEIDDDNYYDDYYYYDDDDKYYYGDREFGYDGEVHLAPVLPGNRAKPGQRHPYSYKKPSRNHLPFRKGIQAFELIRVLGQKLLNVLVNFGFCGKFIK